MREKVGIIYALYGSIQRTHHVYIQWLLQDRHTLCSTQRMAWRGVAGADGGREKYPLNTSQKKKFTLQAQQTNILKHPMKNTL